MKRLDDFFASEEIKQAVRVPSPKDTDETIVVVCFKIILFLIFLYSN